MDWRLFTTDGRVTRTHYMIYLVVLWFADMLLGAAAGSIMAGGLGLIVVTVAFAIPVWVSKYCVGVRRAHDSGFSATFVGVMTAFDVVSSLVFTHVTATMSIETFDMPMIRETAIGFGIAMVALIMMGVLSFARPEEDNEWGLDPRA